MVDFNSIPTKNSSRTQGRPVDGLLEISFFNKQSGIRQAATVCGKRFGPKTSDLFCQHFGYAHGDWRVSLESSQFNSRSLSSPFMLLWV